MSQVDSARHPGPASREADGVLSGATPSIATQMIPIQQIDREDRRFQLRVNADAVDPALVSSLRSSGQQTPVVLWGLTHPYRIVDGFRRVEALVASGMDRVLAIVRSDLDQTQALALSYLENDRRKNLTALDRSHAVWLAVHEWEMGKPLVARSFGLSVRQIDRYLKALEFAAPVQHALRSGNIAMAHAALLHRARVDDPSAWVRRIRREKLSAGELGRRLRGQRRLRRRRSYLVREANGFRFHGFRYRSDLGNAERQALLEALETALALVRADAGRGTPSVQTVGAAGSGMREAG